MHGEFKGRVRMDGLRGKTTYQGALANMLAAYGFTVAMVTVMVVVGGATPLDVMIGAPPFMFIVYTVLTLMSTRKAKREEDQKDIASIFDLVSQCKRELVLIGEAVTRGSVDFRTYMALNHLATTVRLLISRYERYIKQKGVWAALEAESLLMMAALSEERELKSCIWSLRGYMDDIEGNVIDADYPRLVALQEASS